MQKPIMKQRMNTQRQANPENDFKSKLNQGYDERINAKIILIICYRGENSWENL